jgi:hypothetical protein
MGKSNSGLSLRITRILETLVVAISAYQLVVKAMHVLGDVIEAILDGEVSGLKPVHLGFWQICQVSFSSLSSEEDIVAHSSQRKRSKQSYDFTPRTDGARLSCCWCVPAATRSTSSQPVRFRLRIQYRILSMSSSRTFCPRRS